MAITFFFGRNMSLTAAESMKWPADESGVDFAASSAVYYRQLHRRK
jgi:hypothetical protein